MMGKNQEYVPLYQYLWELLQVCQIEITTVLYYVEEIIWRSINKKNIIIYSASQAAKKKLTPTHNPKAVMELYKQIKRLGSYKEILACVPCQESHQGNEMSDEVACKGS